MGNRKLVYIPQINPKTFLFFYYEGTSGKSFSFRDYSAQGKPKITYSKAYPSFSVDQILNLAQHIFDAPTHPTTDNDYWQSKIQELNEKYLAFKHQKDEKTDEIKKISTSSVLANRSETTFCIKGQGDKIISSVDDWHLYAPPKKAMVHWKDGKSAKELAKAWFGNRKLCIPQDFLSLLKSHQITSNFEPLVGYAEHKTPLDNFGEPRNHDLILIGYSEKNKILIGVEAKETEDFQEPLSQKRSDNPRSNIENRKQLLAGQLFGRSIDSKIGMIRYQLLTGTAGTLIEAKKHNANYAVFVVHEFLTSRSDKSKSENNSFEIDRFVSAITQNKVSSVKAGMLVEIGCLPGGQCVPSNIPLLFGKVTTYLS